VLAEVARKVDPCIECMFLGVAQSGTCRTDVAAKRDLAPPPVEAAELQPRRGWPITTHTPHILQPCHLPQGDSKPRNIQTVPQAEFHGGAHGRMLFPDVGGSWRSSAQPGPPPKLGKRMQSANLISFRAAAVTMAAERTFGHEAVQLSKFMLYW